jgi:hypothetical protein
MVLKVRVFLEPAGLHARGATPHRRRIGSKTPIPIAKSQSAGGNLAGIKGSLPTLGASPSSARRSQMRSKVKDEAVEQCI